MFFFKSDKHPKRIQDKLDYLRANQELLKKIEVQVDQTDLWEFIKWSGEEVPAGTWHNYEDRYKCRKYLAIMRALYVIREVLPRDQYRLFEIER